MVVSRVVLDRFDETSDTREVLGGSGFWAAFGAATVSDQVALASRVGEDFTAHEGTLDRLGIGRGALLTDGAQTSTTLIRYRAGEERLETPLPDWSAHVRMRAVLADIPPELRAAHAYYVFRGWHPGFWEPLLEHLADRGTPWMWELPASLCVPAERERIAEVLAVPGVLSVNLAEARSLLGPERKNREAADLARELLELGAPVVVLRCGSRGSVVATPEGLFEVGAAHGVVVRDPTGAGNAYSGAFLAVWATTADPVEAARAGSAAAAVAIEAVGPPADRARARARAAELRTTVTVTDLDRSNR